MKFGLDEADSLKTSYFFLIPRVQSGGRKLVYTIKIIISVIRY